MIRFWDFQLTGAPPLLSLVVELNREARWLSLILSLIVV